MVSILTKDSPARQMNSFQPFFYGPAPVRTLTFEADLGWSARRVTPLLGRVLGYFVIAA